MDPFTMVVAIIGIVTLGSIIRAKHNSKKPGMSEKDTVESDRLRNEVRALKERVAVLERLVTDESGPRRLDREIEALRSRDA